MQILGLTECLQSRVTIKKWICLLFSALFCFSRPRKKNPNFYPFHLNSIFNRNRIKRIFLYVDNTNKKNTIDIICFWLLFGQQNSYMWWKFLKSTEPELGSAKFETWSWLLVAGRDLTTHSTLWVTQPHIIGTSNRIPCLVKDKVPFKCNMIY